MNIYNFIWKEISPILTLNHTIQHDLEEGRKDLTVWEYWRLGRSASNQVYASLSLFVCGWMIWIPWGWWLREGIGQEKILWLWYVWKNRDRPFLGKVALVLRTDTTFCLLGLSLRSFWISGSSGHQLLLLNTRSACNKVSFIYNLIVDVNATLLCPESLKSNWVWKLGVSPLWNVPSRILWP